MLVLVATRIDLASRRVWRGEEQTTLTSTEAALLAYLVARPGVDVPRAELLQEVWGYAPGAVSRTVDTVVRHLRNKIERDPRRPHHVLASHGVGYRFEPGPPSPEVGGPPCLVPAERDAFFGRATELAELQQATARARLVTLFGLGGAGKTRLACRFARQEPQRWSGGAWLCDLLQARDAVGIARAVGMALDVKLGGDPIGQIGNVLAGRGPCLVVLDNFEQVAAHAETTLGAWLGRAEQAWFLVTSRQVLGLSGEQVVAVGGLPDPDALALLSDRVRAAVPGWSCGPDQLPLLATIGRQLEGIPLSIELVASRVRVMPLEELSGRLRERLDLVGAPMGGRPPRHLTLTAVLDDSFVLLAPWEQAALAQLSVFEGGILLEAAEAVLDLSRWPVRPPIVDVVQALVDRALVQRAASGRLSLLDCIRQYAADKLDGREPIDVRHGLYFARHGQDDALAALEQRGGGERLARLSAELDDVVAGLERAVARDDGEVAASCALAAAAVLGPFARAAELLEQAAGCATARASRLWLAAGLARRASGQIERCREDLDQALAIAQRTGDRRSEGLAQGGFGFLAFRQGRLDDAAERYEEAHALLCDGDPFDLARLLRYRGQLDKWRARFGPARADLDAALSMFRAVGNRRGEGITLVDFGDVAQDQGLYEEAAACYDAALVLLVEMDDRDTQARVRVNRGRMYELAGQPESARVDLEIALDMNRASGNLAGEAIARMNLVTLEMSQDRRGPALEHAERAVDLCRRTGDREWEAISLSNIGRIHTLEGRSEAAWDPLEQAAALHGELGQQGRAQQIRADLAALGQVTGAPRSSTGPPSGRSPG